MKLNIEKAKKLVNKEFKFKNSMQLSNVILKNLNIKILGDIVVEGNFKFINFEVLNVNFNASVFYETNCDRCAKLITKELQFSCNEMFYPASAEDNEWIYGNSEVDIRECIECNFLTFLPTKNLCKEACKGLCPVCGINKNFSNCDCEKNKQNDNNPFAILQQLKK